MEPSADELNRAAEEVEKLNRQMEEAEKRGDDDLALLLAARAIALTSDLLERSRETFQAGHELRQRALAALRRAGDTAFEA